MFTLIFLDVDIKCQIIKPIIKRLYEIQLNNIIHGETVLAFIVGHFNNCQIGTHQFLL